MPQRGVSTVLSFVQDHKTTEVAHMHQVLRGADKVELNYRAPFFPQVLGRISTACGCVAACMPMLVRAHAVDESSPA